MSPELEHLIRLQDIETRAAEAQKRIADAPAQIAALDARLSASLAGVASAKQALADNHARRRMLDNDLASAQQRLSKYKEQLMAVKTNDEYHAMQHQIAAMEAEVSRVEEQILVNMLDADELAAKLKAAEATLKQDQTSVATERAAIETDTADKRTMLARSNQERAALLPDMSRGALELFERVRKARQGIAVAQAVNGHCTICHVRLRPQVYNTIIKNEAIIQCDHCQRILYFAGVRAQSEAGRASIEAAESRQRDYERPT
ncbi:MAG TPA: C4-type zinc ribbon domain-containing protein [Vicinamibacterales bacterium]|nr:C4-type zinc ribbon domain-containing protein [Vicinamibacterales bacterium]